MNTKTMLLIAGAVGVGYYLATRKAAAPVAVKPMAAPAPQLTEAAVEVPTVVEYVPYPAYPVWGGGYGPIFGGGGRRHHHHHRRRH